MFFASSFFPGQSQAESNIAVFFKLIDRQNLLI